MKRSKPLSASPEKIRAWQQRSREKAAENARERPRKPLRRLPALKRPSAPLAPADAPLPPVRFKASVPARQQWCFRVGCHSRATCHHHWLPVRDIKVYVRGLRLPEREARKMLRRLINDPANYSPTCAGCHESHESPGVTSRRFCGEEVPHSARLFALRLGPEYVERLRHLYPSRSA